MNGLLCSRCNRLHFENPHWCWDGVWWHPIRLIASKEPAPQSMIDPRIGRTYTDRRPATR